MKLLLIHQAFVSPQEAGGTRHFELARFARSRGHAITIVASDLSYLSGKKHVNTHELVAHQEVEGIQVLRAYTYPSLHQSFVWRIVSFLSFMFTSVWAGLRAGPVDVVMGTSPPIFQAFSAWLVAFLKRKPLLLEIRDLWPDFAVDMGVLKNPLLIRASLWLEMFLYRRASRIVVNSPAYRLNIIAKGIPESKISLIPNGVDPSMFDPAENGAAVRQQWKLGKAVVVLYAGALGMANDIPTILRAAQLTKDNNDIIWVFAGDGKERAKLEAMARNLGLEHSTLFTGARPKAEMKQFMGAADICIATLRNIPMFKTTYPNKVFDYMAAGRPTVLGIDGVIREVIESAEGGVFVQPGDAKALAEAVRLLAINPELRKRQGEMARAYVVQHFDRRRQAVQFLDLLQGFLDASA